MARLLLISAHYSVVPLARHFYSHPSIYLIATTWMLNFAANDMTSMWIWRVDGLNVFPCGALMSITFNSGAIYICGSKGPYHVCFPN